MSRTAVLSLLKDFINRNSKVYSIGWDPNISEPLLFDPFSQRPQDQMKIAHYFLLVASITDSSIIGRAENSRALMIFLHQSLDDTIFSIQNPEVIRELLHDAPHYKQLGFAKSQIPAILTSVNRFVNTDAKGNFLEYSTRFSQPQSLVLQLSQAIQQMHIDKAWMYIRWMTRPAPDLDIFHFSPSSLLVPLTSNIQAVAACFGLCPPPTHDFWKDPEKLAFSRQRVTEFARSLFPTDPCKIDYPLYLLGRWIRGRRLNLQLLYDYLCFFEETYHKTGSSPVMYDIVSREVSSFESQIRHELDKLKILFYYESHRFSLPHRTTYLPDFVLPRCQISGKTVLLEPHGIWTRKCHRNVMIGGRSMTFYAFPQKVEHSEIQFTEKLRIFREMYGRFYYLILLVPNQVYDRVKTEYTSSFDAVYMGSDIPKLLFRLKQTCLA